MQRSHLECAQTLAREVRAALVQRLSHNGFLGDSLANPADLKSTHNIDQIAMGVIRRELGDEPARVVIEGDTACLREDVRYTIFIDPIDGSLNWDRGVGDPCFVMAVADKTTAITFADITFAYVEGLRSGDCYYTQDGKAYFFCAITEQTKQIVAKGKTSIADATAYLRPGYRLAQLQIETCFPLFFRVKDIRAFENTGIEICEIARNAADFIVEARHASDFFNLLAWPILRAAGGVLSDLEGESFEKLFIDIDANYDFVVCSNSALHAQVIKSISEWKAKGQDNFQLVSRQIADF